MSPKVKKEELKPTGIPGLDHLNSEIDSAALADFKRVCGSVRWAMQMTRRRPYPDKETLFKTGDSLWYSLTFRDWLEAYAAHPKIGDREHLRKKFKKGGSWEQKEQAGMDTASEEVITGLVRGNRMYEGKFGYLFLICATGKTAEEMLANLKERILHDQKTELMVTAAEQAKIIRLRLEKLVEQL